MYRYLDWSARFGDCVGVLGFLVSASVRDVVVWIRGLVDSIRVFVFLNCWMS